MVLAKLKLAGAVVAAMFAAWTGTGIPTARAQEVDAPRPESGVDPVRVPENKTGKNYFVDFERGDDATGQANNEKKPFKTTARVAARVEGGDIVYIRGRSHVADHFVPRRSGTADRPITIKAYPGEKPVFTGRTALRGGGGVFDLSNRSHYVLEGIRFADTTAHWSTRVIYLVKSSHITIRNCKFKNNSSSPIKAMSSSHLTIEGCRFDTFGSPAGEGSGDHLFLAGVEHSAVQDCYFTRGGHGAILLGAGGPRGLRGDLADPKKELSRYNKIVNNVIEQDWGGGIYVIMNSEYNLIEGNIISRTGDQRNYPKPGIQINGSRNTVRRNVIFNCSYSGITIQSYPFRGVMQYSRHNLIHNNTIYDTRNVGIHVFVRGAGDVRGNVVANNVVLSTGVRNPVRTREAGIPPGAYGVSLNLYHSNVNWRDLEGKDVFANGNTFHHNLVAHGAAVKGDGLIRYVGKGSRHNHGGPLSFWQTAYPKVFFGNIDDDRPGLVDPKSGKFHLKPGSVLVDKGVPIRDTNGDRGGWKDLAFAGKAPDIGAFEFEPPERRRPPPKGSAKTDGPGAGGANEVDPEAARLYRFARQVERAGMKDLARTLYEQLVKEHPGSPLAEKAEKRLGAE